MRRDLTHVVRMLLALGCAFLMTGCRKESSRLDESYAPRSVEAFKEIGITSSLDDVLHRFGPPDKDVGSGLYIYMYLLPDGSDVRVGASDPTNILYVQHGTNTLFKRPGSLYRLPSPPAVP
jgi:hypothetical protein